MIDEDAIIRRAELIEEIGVLSGNFVEDSARVERELTDEILENGYDSLLDHLRLCGNIPEIYGQNSSEEKLYSKYTDCLLAAAYRNIGLNSLVLQERAGHADVEVFAEDYAFVADAKAFRLSRTAKNQKDFKVGEMDRWRHGKRFAMLVCPIYQLPSRTSAIYRQATTRNVCIFTYSHLALLVRYAREVDENGTKQLITRIFQSVEQMHPSDNAMNYWNTINQEIYSFSNDIRPLWLDEKRASEQSIEVGKEESLAYLALERERIARLSREEAVAQLLAASRIDSKIQTINRVTNNTQLFDNGN